MIPVPNNTVPEILPLLPIYNAPIFPGIMIPIILNSEHLFPNLEKELKSGQFIGLFLVKKKYENIPLPDIEPMMTYSIGSVARIVKKIYLPNQNIHLLVNCLYRIEIEEVVEYAEAPLHRVKTVVIPDVESNNDLETKVLLKTITEQLEYLSTQNLFPLEQLKMAIENSISASRIADFLISVISEIPKEKLQELLETSNVRSRLQKIAIFLQERIKIMKLQEKMMQQINGKMEKQQRDFFLKEQMKAIKEELGMDTDNKEKYLTKFQQRLNDIQKNLKDPEIIETLYNSFSKLESLDPKSPEFSVELTYLETSLFLPWFEQVNKPINIEKSMKILEDSHYGIEDVKHRILEFLAVQKLKKDSKGGIICFVGPPGVGKTSLGKSIAKSLSRPFFRFSVGGMRDEAEIKGHRRTYIGAMPGKIIQGLKITQFNNPVFMIDEIDKIGVSYQGDPASALLEVLDPEQNSNFRDHYLDVPFDLSGVFFITTANTLSTIPEPLLDRMEIISLSGYTAEEKYIIGKNHIIDKQKALNGLEKKDFQLTKQAFLHIAEKYSREAGIRNFERQIAKICRKIAYKKAINESFSAQIDSKDLGQYLGAEIFSQDSKKYIKNAGVSIGLAYTQMGGDTLYIESRLVPSNSGSFKLTGQLGKVMKESAEIAYSYIRSIAKKHHIALLLFEQNTIHLHVPAGAIPKDGPSAGITMAIALYSLLTGKKVPSHFAMTGELTLSGNVFPIGGLKEKSMAAVRAGIPNIIAPEENEKDLSEIPDLIKKHIQYHFVSKLEDVLAILFP